MRSICWGRGNNRPALKLSPRDVRGRTRPVRTNFALQFSRSNDMARTSSHNRPSGMFSYTFALTNLGTDASCLSATSHPVLFYLILLKIRWGGDVRRTDKPIYRYGIFIIWFTVTCKRFREKQRTQMLWIWGAVVCSRAVVTIPK